MKRHRLGRSGPMVSALGLGCNNFGRRLDAQLSRGVVAAALDVGITHFDTADAYGNGRSEEFLGAALRGVRDEVVITTKVGIRRDAPTGGGSPAHVIAACDASLRRLGTDRIDLYYLHKPDPATPREDTVAAFQALAQQGKIRHMACSNHPAWMVTDLWHVADQGTHPPFAGVQLGLSLLDRKAQGELLPACRNAGLGAVAFSPLASGLLTGKYQAGFPFPVGSRLREMPEFTAAATDAALAAAEAVRQFALQQGVRPAALALAWVAAQPGIASVLTGATSPGQIRANAADLAYQLDDQTVDRLDAVLTATNLQEA